MTVLFDGTVLNRCWYETPVKMAFNEQSWRSYWISKFTFSWFENEKRCKKSWIKTAGSLMAFTFCSWQPVNAPVQIAYWLLFVSHSNQLSSICLMEFTCLSSLSEDFSLYLQQTLDVAKHAFSLQGCWRHFTTFLQTIDTIESPQPANLPTLLERTQQVDLFYMVFA